MFSMKSVLITLLVVLGGSVVVLGGSMVVTDDGTVVTVTPCGPLLGKRLCNSMTFCSDLVYSKDNSTCILMNRATGKGVRDCRTLTSRRGNSIHVCDERVKVVDARGHALDPGDVIEFLWSKQFWKAIYIGDGDCVSLNTRPGNFKSKVTKLAVDNILHRITKMVVQPGTLRVFEPKKRIQCALRLLNTNVERLTKTDFISWCVNGHFYREASARHFRFAEIKD